MAYEIHPWKVIETGFEPDKMRLSESLTSTGNGYMGMRGNFEEDYSGDTHLGTYIGGVWFPDKTRVGWWKNGYPQYFGKVINAVRLNGTWSMKRWVTRSPRSQVSCGCTIFTSGRWLRDTPRSRLMSTFRTPITGPRCSTRSGIRWPRNSGLTTCRYSPNGMPARSTRIPAFALIVELRIISCFFLTQSANS